MSVLAWLNERLRYAPPHLDDTSRAVSAEGMAALGLNRAGRMYMRDCATDPATQEIVFRTDDGVARVFPLTRMQAKAMAARLTAAIARGK